MKERRQETGDMRRDAEYPSDLPINVNIHFFTLPGLSSPSTSKTSTAITL
jgi:hypothetical protein